MALKPIRVLIVCGSRAVRTRLDRALICVDRVELVGSDAEPHVVLVDFPWLRATPAIIRGLRDRFPNAEVVALVSFLDDLLVDEAVQAGAIGCLSRNSLDSHTLFKAILFAYNGMRFRVPAAEPTVPTGYSALTNEHDLTEWEHQVLGLLVKGLSHHRIAEQLAIAPSTVTFHTRSIRCKLGTRSRAETVAYALQHQLVP